MEKRISLNPFQISLIQRYAKEREEAMKREHDLIQFIISIENIDPSTILKTDIEGNQFVITLKV